MKSRRDLSDLPVFLIAYIPSIALIVVMIQLFTGWGISREILAYEPYLAIAVFLVYTTALTILLYKNIKGL